MAYIQEIRDDGTLKRRAKALKKPKAKAKKTISPIATKPIPEGSMYNPFTGRMVKITSKAGKMLLSVMRGEDLNAPKKRGRPKKAPKPPKILKIKDAPKPKTPKPAKPRKEVSMTYEGTVKSLKRRIAAAKKATTKARLQSQLDMMIAS